MKQNQEMNNKIEQLQKENQTIQQNQAVTRERLSKNLKSLQDANASVKDTLGQMLMLKEELVSDGWDQYKEVDWFFNNKDFRMLMMAVSMKTDQDESVEVTDTSESMEEDLFDNVGREEKLDLVFGLDGDLSAKSLRRFIEKFKVVKKLNMSAKLRGWDSKEYRADKLKLSLHGDAFDYISFEDSMSKDWTRDDEAIITKLKDRYLNVQAIEMNILKFEKSMQEGKELLNEYLARLQQLVKDAYEGQV